MVLALLCLGAAAALDAARPLIIMAVIDRVIVGGEVDRLLPLVGAIVAVSMAHGLATFGFTYGRRLVGERVVYDLRNAVYAHLQRLDASFYDRHRTGELMSRAGNDVQLIRHMMAFGIFSLLRIAASTAFVLAAAVALSPSLTAIALVGAPGLYVLVRRFHSRIKPASRRTQEWTARLSAAVQENVAGIKVVRAFGQEAQEQAKFEHVNRGNREANLAAAAIRARYAPLLEMWGVLVRGVLLLAGGWLVIEGRVTIGALVALDGYVVRLIQPIREVHHLVDLVGEGFAAAERVFELLDARPALVDPGAGPHGGPRADGAPLPVGGQRPDGTLRPDGGEGIGPVPTMGSDGVERAEGMEGAIAPGERRRRRGGARIVLEGVSLRYGDGHLALRDIDLAVEPGETVLLFGPTGAGKTSLLRLLNRTYDPTEGRILLDGRDMRHVPLKALRRRVGVIPQEPFLFSMSVYDNIAYGRPDAPPEAVEEAARRARAHDFIVELPEGYHTRVGERGAGLSGGQKQRIAIARALLIDPDVLLVDDAASALDAETEARLWEDVAGVLEGRTSFIVTQRPIRLPRPVRIVVLEGGRIVADGDHARVMAASPFYARLWELHGHGKVGSAGGARRG